MPFFQRRKTNVFQICLLYFVIICNNEISECNAAFLRYRFRESLQRLWSYNQGPDRMGIFGTKIDGPGLSGGPTSEGANKKGMTPEPPKDPGPPGGGGGGGGPPGLPKLPGAKPPNTGEAGIKESKKKKNDQLAPCDGTPGAPKPCGAGPYGNKDKEELKKNEKSVMAPLGPALKMQKQNFEIKKYFNRAKESEWKKWKNGKEGKKREEAQKKARAGRMSSRAGTMSQSSKVIPEDKKLIDKKDKEEKDKDEDEDKEKDDVKKEVKEEQKVDEKNEEKEEEELEKKAAVDEIKETVREREKQDAKAYREQIDDYGDEVVEKNVEPPHAPPRKCPPGLKPCDHEDYSVNTKGGPYKKMIPDVPEEQKEAEAKLKKDLDKKDAEKKVLNNLQGDKTRDVNIRKMDETPDLKNMPNIDKKRKLEVNIAKLDKDEKMEIEKNDAAVVEKALFAIDGITNLTEYDNEEGHRGPIGNEGDDMFPPLTYTNIIRNNTIRVVNFTSNYTNVPEDEDDKGEWVPPENTLKFEEEQVEN